MLSPTRAWINTTVMMNKSRPAVHDGLMSMQVGVARVRCASDSLLALLMSWCDATGAGLVRAFGGIEAHLTTQTTVDRARRPRSTTIHDTADTIQLYIVLQTRYSELRMRIEESVQRGALLLTFCVSF